MERRPIVLIHGYSATSAAFNKWREVLIEWGYTPDLIHICNYVSLSDEINVDDLANGFAEALAKQPGLDADEPFDAIVHSTGMLVLRSWAVKYPKQRGRLRHLVGLAPASFGSPLAHKGRTYLGRAVRGNPEQGPDFREAGDKILSALELASPFTWRLASEDLLGANSSYGGPDTPYVSVFCGTSGYQGIMGLVNTPGSDGTVRMAGTALNTRKIEIDLRTSDTLGKLKRYRVAEWSNSDIPVVLIADLDHGTIVSKPSDDLKALVKDALAVETKKDHAEWLARANHHTALVNRKSKQSWQQLVFHVVDENGEGVHDYFVDFHYRKDKVWKTLSEEKFRPEVHSFTDDPSYRCFHIEVSKVKALSDSWAMTIHADSGTELVRYSGWVEDGLKLRAKEVGATAAILIPQRDRVEFFYPLTTTLVEITLDRKPDPAPRPKELVRFVDREQRVTAQEEKKRALEAETRRLEEQQRETRLDELEDGFVAAQGERA